LVQPAANLKLSSSTASAAAAGSLQVPGRIVSVCDLVQALADPVRPLREDLGIGFGRVDAFYAVIGDIQLSSQLQEANRQDRVDRQRHSDENDQGSSR
jgi:hypothetical protein